MGSSDGRAVRRSDDREFRDRVRVLAGGSEGRWSGSAHAAERGVARRRRRFSVPSSHGQGGGGRRRGMPADISHNARVEAGVQDLSQEGVREARAARAEGRYDRRGRSTRTVVVPIRLAVNPSSPSHPACGPGFAWHGTEGQLTAHLDLVGQLAQTGPRNREPPESAGCVVRQPVAATAHFFGALA